MQIVTMKYNHVKYLGNNSSSSLSVEVTLNEKDDAQESFKILESFVMNNLNNKPVSTQVSEALENHNKVEVAKEETPKKEVNNESNNQNSSSEEISKEASSEENSSEKSSSKEKVKKPKAEPKPKKSVNVVYDRNNNNHKMDFSQLLDGLFKGWKADAKMIEKAKVSSIKLEGKEMYSPEGKILDEFVATLKEEMSVESPIKA